MSLNETIQYPKRLIEVDLPIARISAHARREKAINHGHISTLHIWWARRPLAACRAVICAALWPDPADVICPQKFRDDAFRILSDLQKKIEQGLISADRRAAEEAVSRMTFAKEPNAHLDLRKSLLDFIAEFANWDLSTNSLFLEASRALTQSAHESLGGEPGTRPLVVDPFAGGGSIPLEALRVGADAFASDLNPIPVLLNKVVLEYIPKYGQRLADEVRKWGEWIKKEAEKELAKFYPKDTDGATPIAYLWARTIRCEGPGCGAEIPLIKATLLDSKSSGRVVNLLIAKNPCNNSVITEVVESKNGVPATVTVRGWSATCPVCGFTTKKKNVQEQLAKLKGGSSKSRLTAVVTSKEGQSGKKFRNPTTEDFSILSKIDEAISSPQYKDVLESLKAPLPGRQAHRAVGSQLPLYGLKNYEDLFLPRQKLALVCLARTIERVNITDPELNQIVRVLLSFCLAKQADYATTLCRWRHDGAYVNPTLGGEKKYVMISDFAESCPLSHGSGNWLGQIDWVTRVLNREIVIQNCSGQVVQSSADLKVLPEDSSDAMITDPPYYDSVPYSDLSNFFYVWLRPLLYEQFPDLLGMQVAPKIEEMTVDHPGNAAETEAYRNGLTRAFDNGRSTTKPSGIGVIVFAHKSTAGWESLLAAIVEAGWSIVASWPIDTELQNRLNARGTASLASSVHIVCRPRENSNGMIRRDEAGDWRDVLSELPRRIHEWMPRLASEGVVGADAIFSCLGPALEVFSRYSRVEKASGEQVTLKEYLEHVWAAVSNEALSMIFKDADASGLEPDARLTAMWLWTLGAAKPGSTETTEPDGEEPADSDDDDGEKAPKGKVTGFSLEYDAARKIAQGLGIHLEKAPSVVEVKGDQARLLPVGERTRYLFGKEAIDPTQAPKRRKKQEKQMDMFAALEMADAAEDLERPDLKAPSPGDSVLDRVHQAMILFGAGRAEALKRFLVEDGVGKDPRFWKLAQSLSALYPAQIEEKRWVDGVLARKKSFGY